MNAKQREKKRSKTKRQLAMSVGNGDETREGKKGGKGKSLASKGCQKGLQILAGSGVSCSRQGVVRGGGGDDPSLGHLGPGVIRGRLAFVSPFVSSSGGVGMSWWCLGWSWVRLGKSWGVLGASLGALGAS